MHGLLLAALLLQGCATGSKQSAPGIVTAVRLADGVQLLQDDQPVLFYRSAPLPGREPWRVHYVHPLHSVAGAVVTEDAPADHVHHRGIFWAWRRIMLDGAVVADGWVGKGLELALGTPRVRSFPDGSAAIDVGADWIVPVGGVPTPIIRENSMIRAYPVVDGRRRVEVSVNLKALRPGVALAGTADDKGYGGVSLRFAKTPLVEIQSDGRPIRATVAGMTTGDWVDFSWPTLAAPWPARISAACSAGGQPWTRWVLRQEPSMQNCAFPGSSPVEVPEMDSLRLGVVLLVD